MEYWRGEMWWTLSEDWRCIVCGHKGMTWGFVHAECRCDMCHARYYMRDRDKKVVTVPITLLKDNFREPARELWEKYRLPIDELTDAQWEETDIVLDG